MRTTPSLSIHFVRMRSGLLFTLTRDTEAFCLEGSWLAAAIRTVAVDGPVLVFVPEQRRSANCLY